MPLFKGSGTPRFAPEGHQKKRANKRAGSDVAHLHLEPQNPHLPAAAPAGFLSRKITGEVKRTAPPAPNPSNRDEVPHLSFLVLGAGVTPAEGSVKPTEGFTFNSVIVMRRRASSCRRPNRARPADPLGPH
jgi:hypothetical protein